MDLNRTKRFQRRSLVHSLELHNLIRTVQPFRLHSLDQHHNQIRIHKEPFRLRKMDQQPMYRSKSSKLRNRDHRANDAKGRHQSFGRKG